MSSTAVASLPPSTATGNRPFTRLWGAFGAGTLADGIYQVALPVAALHLGGGAGSVALVLMAARAPWLVASLHVGVLVDRVDRRRLLLLVSGVRFAVLALLAVLLTAGWGSIAALAAVALTLGVCETIFDTALHSSTPRVVPGERLEAANSRLQATETVANRFLGPALGGVLAGAATAAAFGAVGALYLAAFTALLGLRIPHVPPPAARESVGRALRTGLTVLWRDRPLLSYALGGCAVNCGFAAYYVALPILALEPGGLGLTAGGYGLLLAVGGIGGLLTSMASPALARRYPVRRCIAASAVLLAAGLAVPAVTDRVPLVALGVVATGAVVLISVVTVSYRQRAVPDEMLGRVTAAYRMFAFGGLPLGSGLAGLIGGFGSSRLVFPVAGALVVVAGAAMTLATPREKVPAT